MAGATKRMRGLAIHRSILIGNTATPLTDAERHLYPPDHTHKWTVAVRSAATNPLPNIPNAEQQAAIAAGRSSSAAPHNQGTPASGSRTGTPAPAEGSAAARVAGSATPAATGMNTRGRDHETDYHKMVGGKDDISHYIKRVQFKLHETYPQATRNIDKPPFQVTETGWGEFDIQIKIFFVPESGEKPLSTFHRLKLHPWHPVTIAAPEPSLPAPQIEDARPTTADAESTEGGATSSAAVGADTSSASVKPEDGTAGAAAVHETRAQSAAAHAAPPRVVPPVVHSWSYDEVVFPEPLEPFYETLISNPPTPLPGLSAQAYSDPMVFRMYRSALDKLDATSGPSGRDMHAESAMRPPHPVHDTSGALFDALSQEAVLAEAQRLDKARHSAVHELEDTRTRLIEAEKRVREIRPRLAGAA